MSHHAMHSHIQALQARHAAIASRIEKSQHFAGLSDLEMRQLKREKLRLKEQIEGIRSTS